MLAYVYFEDPRAVAKLLTRDKARIAEFVKLASPVISRISYAEPESSRGRHTLIEADKAAIPCPTSAMLHAPRESLGFGCSAKQSRRSDNN